MRVKIILVFVVLLFLLIGFILLNRITVLFQYLEDIRFLYNLF